MNEAIKKLIDGGRYHPISTASMDGTGIIIKMPDNLYYTAYGDPHEGFYDMDGILIDVPKDALWTYLPIDRLPDALEIAVDTLEQIKAKIEAARRVGCSIDVWDVADDGLKEIQAILEVKNAVQQTI
jgi:hypothetical protein